MKKSKFYLLPLTLLFCGCNMDSPDIVSNSPQTEESYFVSIEDAIETADKFFAQLEDTPGTRTHRVVKNIETYKRGNILTRSSNTAPDFYVINYMDEGGFALVSTDSRRIPVYAFSTEGHMSLSDTVTNEGLRNYLNECAISPVSPVFPRDTTLTAIGDELKILVPPMLDENPRNWDQMSLNKYVCPNKIDSIPVGCVALATGQIMSYFRWPDRWPIDGYETAKERYTFNWTEMLKTRYNDPTARLMEILGRAENLNMRYRKKESSAYIDRVPLTMEKMGYKKPRQVAFNSDTVINTLYKKSPIIMSGYPQEGGSGHAWTVDGFAQCKRPLLKIDTGEIEYVYHLYYHFIWGNWGGSNGYFYYDDSLRSFEDQARAFDEVDYGHGNINTRWRNISTLIDFQVDTSKLH
ncbi:MAG: hypothetical protein HDR88_00190 [Bacteroides sp.]|nr:hypothetical protein [Bacteroides sp.]